MCDRGATEGPRLRECKARADKKIDGAGTATETAEERGGDDGRIRPMKGRVHILRNAGPAPFRGA